MQLWERTLSGVKKRVTEQNYDIWFRPTQSEREDLEKRQICVRVPNRHFQYWLAENYAGVIEEALVEAGLEQYQVTFSLEAPGNGAGPGRSPAEEPGADAAAACSLNGKYTFGKFVVGSSNQFAHAAARAVAKQPSKTYNPLFIYGGVGLGKTHLMHAMGHSIRRHSPHLRLVYMSSERFMNELINSIRYDKTLQFREKYRNIDVLLVDDIQVLANKERTQEEFFHTFNTLYTSQKQIILSSDSSPRNIPALEERLRSRFEWGLIADIQPPDLETKVAILRRKAELERLSLPDDVALFIARQVRSNIRELEGLLNRVLAFSSLTGKPLSLELAKETLRDILPPEDRRVSAGEIIKLVARHYGLRVTEIKSRKNSHQIVFPRQVAMYLCKKLTDLSFPEIGKQFNDKHHSTVMYSVEKIEQQRASNADLDRTLQQMIEHFS